MAVILFDSEVITNEKLNYKFHLVQLRLKKSKEVFSFQPGQFVVIKIGSSLYRSYSVASNPHELPCWRLLVDVTPGGPGSKLLKNLKSGQVIQHSSGKGTFILRKESAAYSIMAATGCGLASFIPMVEELLRQANKKITLIWGLRYQKDLCLLNWLDSLSGNSNFSYQIALSKPSKNWKGAKGHLTSLLSELVSAIPYQASDVYLCGNKLMINDVKSLLEMKGFNEDKIYFERYY